jgi:hypothetical protein
VRDHIPGKNGLDPFDPSTGTNLFYTCPRAEILDINEKKGTCTVQYESTMGQRKDVQILMPYFSHNQKNPESSSWIRVMPQIGDIVLINFDPNGTPYIVSYSCVDYETIQNLSSSDYPGFIFRQLKQGEIDIRSSGMAGLYLSRGGFCRTYAGNQYRTLFKGTMQETASLGLSLTVSDNTVVRIGDAKRKKTPLSLTESLVTDSKSLQCKEVDFKISQSVGPLELPVCRWSVGNVIDSTLTGGKELKLNGVPIRHYLRIHDLTGLLTTYQEAIDYKGNASVEFGTLATSGLSISGSVSPFSISNKSLDWACLTGINFSTQAGGISLSATAGGISATATAGNAELKAAAGIANVDGGLSVKLGNSAMAVNPVIRGTVYTTLEGNFLDKLTALLASVGALLATLVPVSGATPPQQAAVAKALAEWLVVTQSFRASLVPGASLSIKTFTE